MPMQTRLGGTWQQITGAKAFLSGSWRTIKAIKAYIGGEWRDVANFSPPGPGGGGGGTLTLSLSASSVGRATANSSTVTTNVTVTPSGGIAPYTYSWAKQSGDAITASATTAATTAFSASSLVVDETRTAVFRCTCTDSLGVSATSGDVTVTITRFERSGVPGGGNF